MKGIAV